MNNLFDLKDGKIIIEPHILNVPEFKKIWDGDKDKNKLGAYNTLSYVFYICDYNSPYAAYPDDIREKQVRNDFIKDKDWKQTKDITAAIEKYKEMMETPSIRLLKAVKSTVDKMATFLQNTSVDDETVKTIIETISKVSDVISNSSKLEKAVREENAVGSKIRGNNIIGNRER